MVGEYFILIHPEKAHILRRVNSEGVACAPKYLLNCWRLISRERQTIATDL